MKQVRGAGIPVLFLYLFVYKYSIIMRVSTKYRRRSWCFRSFFVFNILLVIDMSTVKDPGRLAKPVYIGRIIRQRLSGKLAGLGFGSSRNHDFSILPNEWAPPDSTYAKEAERVVAELCNPIISAHSYRTYCFGAILGTRDGLKFDRELFYIAALLHDLGLTEAYEAEAGSFEWVGARKGREFCLQQGWPESKADLVHDAIALHTSFGLATSREPEVAMVHFGAGVDVLGRRLEEIPKTSLSQVLEQYSRDGCTEHFSACLYKQAELKPDSHISGLVEIGLSERLVDSL